MVVNKHQHINNESELYEQLVDEVFVSSNRKNAVGIEVEYFPMLRSHLHTPAAQPGREEGKGFMGLYPWLILLADRYGWKPMPVESSAAIAFTLKGGGRLTLEPGGQIEYSSPPYPHYREALKGAEEFERLLCEEGAKVDLIFLTEGFNRQLGEETPRLVVEKPRYLLMDQHFEKIGPYGRMMMRQTCATQINLDFGPPEMAIERWNLASLAAPALNALFANASHVHDGKCWKSFRYQIWRKTDPSRTNIPWEEFAKGDPVAHYLRFALNATVLMIVDPIEGFRPPRRSMTFAQWMKEGEERYPDLDDWRTHLTTLFPDVRPRGFIEIRSLDALPIAERRAAVELTTALLYDGDLRKKALAWFQDPVRRKKGSPQSTWEERFEIGKGLLGMGLENSQLEYLQWYDEAKGPVVQRV